MKLTAVESEFQGFNFSSSPERLNITENLTGSPPYDLAGGQYLVWDALPVNPENFSVPLYAVIIVTPGFVWNGPGTYGSVYFSPHGSMPLSVQFTLPYQNYTGPLVFELQV